MDTVVHNTIFSHPLPHELVPKKDNDVFVFKINLPHDEQTLKARFTLTTSIGLVFEYDVKREIVLLHYSATQLSYTDDHALTRDIRIRSHLFQFSKIRISEYIVVQHPKLSSDKYLVISDDDYLHEGIETTLPTNINQQKHTEFPIPKASDESTILTIVLCVSCVLSTASPVRSAINCNSWVNSNDSNPMAITDAIPLCDTDFSEQPTVLEYLHAICDNNVAAVEPKTDLTHMLSLENMETSDMLLNINSDDDAAAMKIPVHKAILACCSPVFKALFYGTGTTMAYILTGRLHIDEVDRGAFQLFCKLIYGYTLKKCDLIVKDDADDTTSVIFHLIKLADRYEILSLMQELFRVLDPLITDLTVMEIRTFLTDTCALNACSQPTIDRCNRFIVDTSTLTCELLDTLTPQQLQILSIHAKQKQNDASSSSSLKGITK